MFFPPNDGGSASVFIKGNGRGSSHAQYILSISKLLRDSSICSLSFSGLEISSWTKDQLVQLAEDFVTSSQLRSLSFSESTLLTFQIASSEITETMTNFLETVIKSANIKTFRLERTRLPADIGPTLIDLAGDRNVACRIELSPDCGAMPDFRPGREEVRRQLEWQEQIDKLQTEKHKIWAAEAWQRMMTPATVPT